VVRTIMFGLIALSGMVIIWVFVNKAGGVMGLTNDKGPSGYLFPIIAGGGMVVVGLCIAADGVERMAAPEYHVIFKLLSAAS